MVWTIESEIGREICPTMVATPTKTFDVIFDGADGVVVKGGELLKVRNQKISMTGSRKESADIIHGSPRQNES